MATTTTSSKPAAPLKYPFYLGGLAAASAATITHPLDLTRYRLQTSIGKQSMMGSIMGTARTEGARGLFHGLTATWLRQFTYSVSRFAVYEGLKSNLTEPGEKPSAAKLAFFAGTAGAFAGIIGNPAEIVLVRTAGDILKAPADQFAYGNCLNGVYRIVKDEGAGKLFLGLTPNIARSVIMNVGQLASYDVFKGLLLNATSMQDGPTLQFVASFCAGTTAVTLTCPADVIKQRVQSSKTNEGVLKVLRGALATDGPKVLLRGWLPAWLRLQPQTTLLFLFFEQYKKIFDTKFRRSSAS